MRWSPGALGPAQLLSQMALLPGIVGKTKQRNIAGILKRLPKGSLQAKIGHEQKQGTTAAHLHTAPPRGVKPPYSPVSSYLITLLDALK